MFPMRIRASFVVSAFLLMIAAASIDASQGAAKLPAAIESAFKAAYPKATIKGVSKEKYAGKDAYEVESIDGGKTRDLVYLPDGSVMVVEEQIEAADLPPAVAAAIAKGFPKATVVRYERAVERGVTSYEVQFKGGKSAEYTAAGRPK